MRAGGFRVSIALPCAWLATALLAFGNVTAVVTAEDTPSQPLLLNISSLDEGRTISFFAKASNPMIVPDGNVQFRQTGSDATMVVTPALNETGTTSLSIHATDGITTVTQLVNVTVTAVNDAPTLSRIPDQIIPESGSTARISFTVGDVETPAASLLVTANSSDASLLPNEAIVISGSGAIRTLMVTPHGGRSGAVRATVTVSDGEASTVRDFEIRVGTVNHAPVANAGPDQTLLATNVTSLNGTATDDGSDRLLASWTVVAGPSDVEFANPSSLNTGVRFGAHGIYTLRLTVSDGDLSDRDDVAIVVAGGAIARVQEPRRKRR